LVLFFSGWPVCDRSVNVLSSGYQRVNDSLNLLGFTLFVCGNLWVLNAGRCEETASAVHSLSLALLVISYLIMLMPCLLLVLLAPLVFFCLPLLIRLSVALQPERGAPDSEIIQLASETYEPGSIPPEDCQCAICLQDYEAGEKLRRLPCSGRHHFHQSCIDNWLRVNDSCPLDRQPIVRRPANEALSPELSGRSYQQPSESESDEAARREIENRV
jgi:hypothetical protein